MSGRKVLEVLRAELRPLNEYILNHPYVKDAEQGKLPVDLIKEFVISQLYIVPHDLRALAHILSRARFRDEVEFFKVLVDGDYKAFKELIKLAEELGVNVDKPPSPKPEAVTYTHYLSWLALNGTLGDAAIALVVNLPVWGSNTLRLAKALRKNYGIRSVGFLEAFGGPYDELERMAYPIIERYLDMDRYRSVSKMIQAYERMFWDSIYSGR
ncbi:MAG: TenA family transcriptional regulator [Thermoprotei archaeon]|nr:MAG: TenA family transcriptional regulator [Thermoprotei archaeon]